MNDSAGNLLQAAQQILDTERMLGGEFLPAARNPLPEIAVQAPTREVPDELSAGDKAASLEELKTQTVDTCTACPLSDTRTHVVFGEGSPDADLVFVGEAPGAEEDRQGRPFVGRAGELLNNMIAAMGLSRDDVFICNILKCRPPNNRNPNPQEVECCWGYLVGQLQIIRPKVIVTLGNPATQTLLNTRTGITRLRGNWQELPDIGEGLAGTPVMPTFHPAYVLRQYTPANRQKVWSDLQAVMKKLGLKPPRPAKKTGDD